MFTEAELKKWEGDAAHVIANPAAYQAMVFDAARTISTLTAALREAKLAADAILAPMTMEFGRIMEEAPDQEIKMTLCSVKASVPAGKFMALYHATDF